MMKGCGILGVVQVSEHYRGWLVARVSHFIRTDVRSTASNKNTDDVTESGMFSQTPSSALCSAQTSGGVCDSAQTPMSLKKMLGGKKRREDSHCCWSLCEVLATQSGGLPLPTQGNSVVQVLALHVHIHEVEPCCTGAAVP